MAKIVDEGEVKRWFEEGRTYEWMVDEYLRKYNIEISLSAFGNFRRRKGLARRIVRNDDLIPWEVQKHHRWEEPVVMLRAEARRRARRELKAKDARDLESWKRRLREADRVVHYDPDTVEGFWLVPRRPGIDLDLIREPEKKTTRRRAAD